MPRAKLAEVDLPDFGMPMRCPSPAGSTRSGSTGSGSAAQRSGYDRVVVYADREHSASNVLPHRVRPPLEEALLVVGPTTSRRSWSGNECWGMAGAAPLPLRRHLFQELSLPSQPRDRSRALGELLGDEGVGAGSRVGVVGWKVFASRAAMDLPAFVVDELRALTGPGTVENATDLLVDAADGLRVVNEPEQLALFEYAACTPPRGLPAAVRWRRHDRAGARCACLD